MRPPRPSRQTVALGLLALGLVVWAAAFEPDAWPRPTGRDADYHRAAGEWVIEGALDPGRAEGLYLPYLPLLSAAARAAGSRGPALLNALALVAALAAAASAPGWRRTPPAALLALAVAGTLLPWQMLLAEPWVVLLAVAAVAMALAFRREAAPPGQAPDRFPSPEPGWRLAGRWLAVGALLAALVAAHPFYAVLYLPAVVAASGEGARARPARLALGAGAIAGLGGAGLAGLAIVGRFAVYAGSPFGAGAAWALDPSLAGWNLAYLFAGRHVGLLPWCLPALALAAAGWRPSGRRVLLLSVAAAAVAFVLFLPFDFHGDAEAFGNRRFLPLFGALWLAPRESVRGRWLAATAVAAALFVGPLWLAPHAPPRTERATARHAAGPLARRLLFEHSQRSIPVAGEGRFGALWVRTVDGARVGPAGGFRFDAGRGARFLLAAPAERESVWLQFGAGAGAELEVAGGEPGDTLYRPDGSVAFEVLLGRPLGRHRMWWSAERQRLDRLTLTMPQASGEVEMIPTGAVAPDDR